MNPTQVSQIFKIVQLEAEGRQLDNKLERLKSQHQQIMNKREKIISSLLKQGVRDLDLEAQLKEVRKLQSVE